MKTILLLSVLSFSSMAMAQSVVADKTLPASITCVSEAASSAVKAFEITELNTTSPDSTITDSGLLDFEITNNLVDITFSNECDNYYGLVFYKIDLASLKSGAKLEVKGLLNYGDVELSEARNTEDQIEETVTVTCRLK